MANTVYIVTQGCWEDYHIEGVFSTRERAESYKAKLDARNHGVIENWPNEAATIEEYVEDEELRELP